MISLELYPLLAFRSDRSHFARMMHSVHRQPVARLGFATRDGLEAWIAGYYAADGRRAIIVLSGCPTGEPYIPIA